jgi:hypothetical protein
MRLNDYCRIFPKSTIVLNPPLEYMACHEEMVSNYSVLDSSLRLH